MRRFARVVAWCAVLLAGAAADSWADEGLYLTWNDCFLGASSQNNANFDCASDAGSHRLFCAFRVGAPIDSVIGIEAVVDLQVDAPNLGAVPWWEMSTAAQPPDCRAGSLGASQDFAAYPSCVDTWMLPLGPAIVQGYLEGVPAASNRARIEVVAGLLSDQPLVTLAAGTPGPMYHAVQIVIDHRNTSSCAGCQARACFLLESIWVLRASGRNVLLQAPGPADANIVVWRGANPSDCSSVPVRRATWGRLKSLYR